MLFIVRVGGQDVLSGSLTAGSGVSFGVYAITVGSAANDAANDLQHTSSNVARASVALSMLDAHSAAPAAHLYLVVASMPPRESRNYPVLTPPSVIV